MKLFLTFTNNMDSLKACGPPLLEAIYTDLTIIIVSISEYTKSNGYVLFKRSSKQNYISAPFYTILIYIMA